MAAICFQESEDFANTYKQNSEMIFVRFLDQAINQDVKSITHPITVNIPSTTEALCAFDHISIEKGASFIRMIDSFVGR